MSRKFRPCDQQLLLTLFDTYGEKKWDKITEIYNEKTNDNWTKLELRRKKGNLKKQGVKLPKESNEPSQTDHSGLKSEKNAIWGSSSTVYLKF